MASLELVYVCAQKRLVQYHLDFKPGDTVADAIKASGIYQDYPETIGLAIGIYSKRVSPDTLLRSGDRIELYRPLSLDPKDNRRLRAKHS